MAIGLQCMRQEDIKEQESFRILEEVSVLWQQCCQRSINSRYSCVHDGDSRGRQKAQRAYMAAVPVTLTSSSCEQVVSNRSGGNLAEISRAIHARGRVAWRGPQSGRA